MESDKLLEQVRTKARTWLGSGYDASTQEAVRAMLDNADTTELVDAFYRDLEFGTGGLRGIMGAGSNRMNRYTVAAATQGLANYLLREFATLPQISVAIGYDCRNNSRFFADTTAAVFSANGIRVYLFEELRPTPEVSYAIRKLGCQSGVMVTASHNPKEYNGYKAYWEDGAQIIAPHDRNIIAEVNKIRSITDIKFEANPALIRMIGEDIDAPFIADVKALSLSPESIARHRDMKIVYTPIHGTGGTIIPRALQEYGFANIIHVPEQDVTSGDFPTVHSPNPEEPAALAMAIAKAEETGSDLVLASDPDADRIGVAARNDRGEMVLINGNEICAMLIYYSIMRRKELGDLQADDYIVKTIVTTELVREIADREHVTMYDCYTGFKWIAGVIRENEGRRRYIGGGEESYGFLWEDFVRDKSSVSACALFCEMAAWARDKGLTVYQLMRSIYLSYGFYREKGVSVVRKGKSGAEEIEAMMKRYREHAPTVLGGSVVSEVLDYATLEGKDVANGETFTLDMSTTSNVLQYKTEDGTKVSVRPSGTEPKIKFYIGVRIPVQNEEELDRAYTLADDKIAAILRDLNV
ncbi:phospho-sugar mutase [Porphyromonas loveana]|uniref:phospho-sugar mutase n=1 Tax=Porphyromonas loveana TaxID=1884669 RepID=UPI00359F6A93